MADIREKIISKYNIDVAQENIFKLYKIDSDDITQEALEDKISETRKRWNISVNGANEKNAKRDRERLDKADSFEAILRDKKLRTELYKFYTSKSSAKGTTAMPDADSSIEFAKEYFSLVATTKKIKKADVEFFFKYFQSHRKHKKAILEMLSKDMKIVGVGKEEMYVDEEDENDETVKKKKSSVPFVRNLFQEATILKVKRAVEKYEEAIKEDDVCQKFPKLKESMYAYLEIEDSEDIQSYIQCIKEKSKEAYNMRQEKGSQYVPLVDMLNILETVGEYQDIVDNISEFKLLLKYPNLTPYMYAFVDVKMTTIKGLIQIANKYYHFINESDFILSYYKQVHDNFGVTDGKISSLIRKAEKKAKQNKVVKKVNEKIKKNKKKHTGILLNVIYFCTYWPLYLLYAIFEFAKIFFTHFHILAIPIAGGILVLSNIFFSELFNIENITALRKIFFIDEWRQCVEKFMGMSINSGFSLFYHSIVTIGAYILIYVVPAYIVYSFMIQLAESFNKDFDWHGIHRTFENIFEVLRYKTEQFYSLSKKILYKKSLLKIAINILCSVVLGIIIYFIPILLNKIGENAGVTWDNSGYEVMTDENGTDNELETTTQNIEERLMIIIKESSNIRSGPGVEYEVVTVVHKDDIFIFTGNQTTLPSGATWYEVYLDEEKSKSGWASEVVIKFRDN